VLLGNALATVRITHAPLGAPAVARLRCLGNWSHASGTLALAAGPFGFWRAEVLGRQSL